MQGEPPPGEPEPSKAERPATKAADDPALRAGLALAPAFRAAFESESRDAAWAGAEETRLTKLLHEAGLPTDAVSEVRCQRTVCRVAFDAVSVEPARQAQIYGRLQNELGPGLSLEAASAEREPRGNLYVLRKGVELEQQ